MTRLSAEAVAAIQLAVTEIGERRLRQPLEPIDASYLHELAARLLADRAEGEAERARLASEVARLEANLKAVAAATQAHFDRLAAAQRADAERVRGLVEALTRLENAASAFGVRSDDLMDALRGARAALAAAPEPGADGGGR